MAYCTQSDLEQRFGQAQLVQLTNPGDFTATAVGADALADAMADIEALISAKLQPRYVVPPATVPLVLRNIACDLVRARLAADTMTDRMAERERAAMKLLDQIAAGTLQIGLDASGDTPVQLGGPEAAGGAARVFSADALRDFHLG